MPAIAAIQELKSVYTTLQSIKETSPDFYERLQFLVFKTEYNNIPHGYVCQRITDAKTKKDYSSKIHNPIKRKEIDDEISRLQAHYCSKFNQLALLLKLNNDIGYKNICRMILGDTPEMLKGVNSR